MEIKTDEILDPEHLTDDDLECVKKMAVARTEGFDGLKDDPIERGLVNGYIVRTMGEDLEASGEAKVSEVAAKESGDAEVAEIAAKESAYAAEDCVRGESGKELSPEQIKKRWLGKFKDRFESLPGLHRGVQWADVEKSLKADPESIRKLMELDEKGYAMNVFGEKNGEIQFRTAQEDITKIELKHRYIMYDNEVQTDYFPALLVNGNAEVIAKVMGVELAGEKLYKQLIVQNGWVWLETPADIRETGHACYGDRDGVRKWGAFIHCVRGSLCVALRVKKA